MISLVMHDQNALIEQVSKDNYFMVERSNRPFLLALVAEEFLYTPAQKERLIDYLNTLDNPERTS